MNRLLTLATFVAGAVVTAGMGSIAAHASPNLVTNGGFETTTNGNGQIIPGQTTGTNITSAPGWFSYSTSSNAGSPFLFITNNAVTTGFNDNWDNGVRYLYGSSGPGGAANGWNGTSPAGGNYLVADGDYHTTPISQAISGLVSGTTYALTFQWAAAQFAGYSGATTEDWAVKLGNQVQYTPTYNLPSNGFSGWMNAAMNFTYDGTNNALSFLAQGTPAGEPPMLLLDNVSLTAVPEPTSMALMGSAVLAGVVLVRRRKDRVAI